MTEPRPSDSDESGLGDETIATAVRLARFLMVEPRTRLDPHRALAMAGDAIPAAQHLSITVSRLSGPSRTMAFSDDVAALVDALQFSARQGPCLDAPDSYDAVVVDDITSEERWPGFTARATTRTGVRSSLSIRLSVGDRDTGAVNLYADQPGTFTEREVADASMLAPIIGLAVEAVLREERIANLDTALLTSRQIGTAMGILMARHLVPSDVAFNMLRKASQRLNRKVRDVAEMVTESGEIPAYRPPAHDPSRRSRERDPG